MSANVMSTRNRFAPYGRDLRANQFPASKKSYSEALKCSIDDANEPKHGVTLQICNLDPSIEEGQIRHYLLSQLKAIAPVISLVMESPSMAKIKLPSQQLAKVVVSHLHRKKIGHKRISVSYLKDPSSAETAALKSQVAGLLKVGMTCEPYKFDFHY